MPTERIRSLWRSGPALLFMLAAVALVPLAGLSAERLGWEMFAGIYEPDLNVVEDRGFPGSAFYFIADSYPPNSLVTVYRDGSPIGYMDSGPVGYFEFVVQSEPGDPLERFDITAATDANFSATDEIRLEDDEPLLPPPPGWDGPTFLLFGDPLTPTPTTAPPTSTSTATPEPGTATATATTQPGTSTPTATGAAPTDTPTATPTATPTSTATATATPTSQPPPARRMLLPIVLN